MVTLLIHLPVGISHAREGSGRGEGAPCNDVVPYTMHHTLQISCIYVGV